MPIGRRIAITLLSPLLGLLGVGCARDFPRPDAFAYEGDGPAGPAVFERTLRAHGGESPEALRDLNVSLDGDWPFLLPRVQPLLADVGYRVRSEERILVHELLYAVDYQGPSGNKRVERTREEIRVLYDGVESDDPDVLGSTALTGDSYIYFLLGPLALQGRGEGFVRLSDAVEDGRRYERIHTVLEPGIGLSDRDELVLWIDAETGLTFRVHITIEGFRTTRGAHVDVTFLDYLERDGVVLPSRFHERVRAPISVSAHTWWVTGLDLNRGLAPTDLDAGGWSAAAREPAAPLASSRE